MAEKVDIPGFPGYKVDEDGRVYGRFGQELKHFIRDGIPMVTIRKCGQATSSSVQRLVCLGFFGPPSENQIALRVGDDPMDVSVRSVRWGEFWERRRG